MNLAIKGRKPRISFESLAFSHSSLDDLQCPFNSDILHECHIWNAAFKTS